MAFTTATVVRIEQGNKQLQGAFNEMWAATLTVDPASIAAGAEDTATFTIPGVALGDAVIGYSLGVNQTVDCDANVWVSAANTITVRISNLNAASALDLASSTWKVLIGRPGW
jgi:hypothetical protein